MKPTLKKVKEPYAVKAIRRDPAASEWNSLLEKAVKNKGQWYEVAPLYDSPSTASSAAYEISSGRNQSVPAGKWEAASRIRVISGSTYGVLFVKYLGSK